MGQGRVWGRGTLITSKQIRRHHNFTEKHDEEREAGGEGRMEEQNLALTEKQVQL